MVIGRDPVLADEESTSADELVTLAVDPDIEVLMNCVWLLQAAALGAGA
jgi:hypothetical protein